MAENRISSPIKLERKQVNQQTFIGQVRVCSSISLLEWAFIITSVFSIAASIAITIHRMATAFPVNSPDFTFGILLLLNSAFCAYYIIHGVFRERLHELMVFMLTTGVVVIYLIINYVYSDKDTKGTEKLARLVISCIVGPVLVVLGFIISRKYWISNNLVFHVVGANQEMHRICHVMYTCAGLLSFDLQLQASNIILVLNNNASTISIVEKVILGVGSAISLTWIITGFCAIRRESDLLVWIFFSFSWIAPAYLIYRFVITANTVGRTNVLFPVIYFAGVLAFLVRLALLINMFYARKCFGKGFREKEFIPNNLEPASENVINT